jgi:hypothetical protein
MDPLFDLRKLLMSSDIATILPSILDQYTLKDKVEGAENELAAIIIGNIYKGPLNFKGCNPKISEEVTHTFNPYNKTRDRSVKYIRYVRRYDPTKPCFKTTLAGVEVNPVQ